MAKAVQPRSYFLLCSKNSPQRHVLSTRASVADITCEEALLEKVGH